jgi:hypothetical protein
MAIYNRDQCIERLAMWVKERNEKSGNRTTLLRKTCSGAIVIESDCFNNDDIKKIMYLQQRTLSDWYISAGNECVELHVKFPSDVPVVIITNQRDKMKHDFETSRSTWSSGFRGYRNSWTSKLTAINWDRLANGTLIVKKNSRLDKLLSSSPYCREVNITK